MNCSRSPYWTLDDMQRRPFLRGLGAFVGLAAASTLVEPWERLSRALRHPSRVDRATVASLVSLTVMLESQESHENPRALLGPVEGHLGNVGTLLAGSPPLRTQLCSIAGETAALAGWLAFDIEDRPAAAGYFRVGIEAAKEANDRALGAYLVGSSCVQPAYRERPYARLRRLEGRTFGFARSDASPSTRAWRWRGWDSRMLRRTCGRRRWPPSTQAWSRPGHGCSARLVRRMCSRATL